MEEIWKDIKDWEGLYQVSNLGRVKSFKYNKIRILKLSKTSKGYFNVCLMNKKPYPVLLHRLIAEAFIPNFEKKTCINHINGIKDDNRIDNLEWVTRSENSKHGLANRVNPISKCRHSHNNKSPFNFPNITIAELFIHYPLESTFICDNIGMCKQQMNTYIHGNPISKKNLERIQSEVNRIGKELSEVKLTK